MEAAVRALAVYALQALVVVVTGAVGAFFIRTTAPQVRLGFWRAVVLLCISPEGLQDQRRLRKRSGVRRASQPTDFENVDRNAV